jgi:surface carbohydrate biosynthesis protein
MKVIFHIVDNYRRDLSWRLDLSIKLKKLGYTNYIGTPASIRKLHLSHRNAVILGRLGSTTGNSEFDKEFIKEIENNCSKLIYFHDEGGVFSRNNFTNSVLHTHPVNIINKNYVQKVFVWGINQYNVLKSYVPNDKLMVFGMPRLESVASSCKSDYNKKEFILINSRFGDVNKVDGDISFFDKRRFEIRKEGNPDLKINEIKDDLISEWCSSNISFTYFIEMVHSVISAYPNENFLIRPHPSESVDFYLDVFSTYPNVSVSKEGDLIELFENTKLVLHSQCTTGLEAFFNNVPQINFIPTTNDNSLLTCVSELTPIATNRKNLLYLVNNFLSGNYDDGSDLKNIKKYIANVDNSFSSHNLIIKEIGTFFKNSTTSLSIKINIFVIKYYIKRLLSFFRLINISDNETSRLYWPKLFELDEQYSESIIKSGYKYFKL